MDDRRKRPGAVLGAGLVLGLLADALLRANGEPALNLFLWAAALVGAVALLQRGRGAPTSGEAARLLGVGLAFAATLAWRDSPTLKLLARGATAGAFALAALEAGTAWVRRAGVTRYGLAVAVAAVRSGLGALVPLVDVDWAALREGSAGSRRGHAGAIARGVVIALPLLVVFGGLFMAADAVFQRLVLDAIRIDPEELAGHILLTGFFGWVATGYVYGFLTGTRLPALWAHVPRDGIEDPPLRILARRPSLGITEVGVALGLLAALFATFVLVQFRYLFGGAELVEVTPGLTYAEYARRGFFELVLVVALMVPVLLAADWLLRRERPRDERVFRTIAAVQVVLLAAVMTSALQRIRLYLEAYGLTEARFYATSFLIWLALVLLWFVATVLRGRRDMFAFGALVSAFAIVAGLQAINPDAIIARTNLARERAGKELDAEYIAYHLSGDAVPVLVPALPGVPAEVRCRIAHRLLWLWGSERELDWRNWNRGAARARAVVRAHEAELSRFADECPRPRFRAPAPAPDGAALPGPSGPE